MSSNKYEFTGEEREWLNTGRIVKRIRAIRDIGDGLITAGTLGGWIESEKNLSHDGNCWVADESSVAMSALVSDDAFISKYAQLWDHAHVYGKVHVTDQSSVFGDASVSGDIKLREMSRVCGFAVIENASGFMRGIASVGGHARVTGSIIINDRADVGDHAVIDGKNILLQGECKILGGAKLKGTITVSDHVIIRDNAIVTGLSPMKIEGYTVIGGYARINSEADFMTVHPIGEKHNAITFFRTTDGLFINFRDVTMDIHLFRCELATRFYDEPQTIAECNAACELASGQIFKSRDEYEGDKSDARNRKRDGKGKKDTRQSVETADDYSTR
jgi:carbonic anhydrase/acetyltransferase-like protein (isoleucine patch superfamily)